MLTRMRIWLPDAPGVLGAVAAEIGAVEGNVVGLEVLEREAGVAIDELVVELPDLAGVLEAVCRGVRNVPGAGVEEIKELAGQAADREDTVLGAAAAILAAATPEEAVDALSSSLMSLFELRWLVVADIELRRILRVRGHDAPSVRWVAAFAEGARSGDDPAYDTTNSGVFVEPVPGTVCTVCGGRPVAIRRRERHEIALLATVTSRLASALGAGRPGLTA
jgi:hypothetical protein